MLTFHGIALDLLRDSGHDIGTSDCESGRAPRAHAGDPDQRAAPARRDRSHPAVRARGGQGPGHGVVGGLPVLSQPRRAADGAARGHLRRAGRRPGGRRCRRRALRSPRQMAGARPNPAILGGRRPARVCVSLRLAGPGLQRAAGDDGAVGTGDRRADLPDPRSGRGRLLPPTSPLPAGTHEQLSAFRRQAGSSPPTRPSFAASPPGAACSAPSASSCSATCIGPWSTTRPTSS